MSDPLGLIQGTGGVSPMGRPGVSRDAQPAQGQPTFKDVLMENIRQVNEMQQEANAAIEDLVSNRRSDVEGVMLATHKADTAFRMLLAVRSKVQQAYEEIKQIRV